MSALIVDVDLLANWPQPSRPFVTYYDLISGERTELSGVTTRNWVAKAANLLVDDCDAEEGTRVRIAMPSHWMRVVWLLATWVVGAAVTDGVADVSISGPELDPDTAVAHRLASSFHPLALPFTDPPPEVTDLGLHLPGQPDAFPFTMPPDPTADAVVLDGLHARYAHLPRLSPPSDERLAWAPTALIEEIPRLVAACAGGGSIVIVAGASQTQIADTARQEHARSA